TSRGRSGGSWWRRRGGRRGWPASCQESQTWEQGDRPGRAAIAARRPFRAHSCAGDGDDRSQHGSQRIGGGRSLSSTARIASYHEVMVPLDGSQFAEQALPYAEAVVRRTGARLVLVRVHELPIGADGVALDPQMDEEFRERSREYLGRIADEVASRLGVAVQTRMLVGRAAAMLERAAREGEVDMVVMSTHGRGGFERVWLGSVADEVVRCLEVPVLLVRPRNDGDASRRATFDRILVALDGSVLSEQILPHASALGLPGRTQYTLVRV